MDHKYFQSRLSAFVDGELPADQQARVAEHIEQCQECRGRLDELRRLEALTERSSELTGTDYWETSARRIETNLNRPATPVTDLTEARTKARSTLWWKLPAIAASIVLVGYIGLHERDILEDDLMIPPSESASQAPGADDDRVVVKEAAEEARLDESDTVSQPSIEPPAPAPTAKRKISGESETLSRQDQLSRIEGEAAVPPAVSQTKEEAVERVELPSPVRMKPRSKAAVADVGREETTDYDAYADDYVETELEETGEAGPTLEADREAMDEVFALDEMRHRRDSLVALISELEGRPISSKKRQALTQGFAASAPDNRGGAAEAVVHRTTLERARSDLVDAWCRICSLSGDETEIETGIGFLRETMAEGTPADREQAEVCLESLGHQ